MNVICEMCGRAADCTHHLVFGRGLRELADADKLYMAICNECHTAAQKPADRIHENPAAEKLSKKLGQMMFERDYIAKNSPGLKESARRAFMERYGRNYL